jgi:hypothetical protein
MRNGGIAALNGGLLSCHVILVGQLGHIYCIFESAGWI